MSKEKIWYIPTESHTERVFAPEDYEQMLTEFDVTVNDTGRNLETHEVAEGIAGFDGLVTGWGSPSLHEELFENADRLKIIAHSAGSVKFMINQKLIDEYLIPDNITVFSGNVAIAYNVAESTIGMLLMTMRRWPDMNGYFKETGNWKDPDTRWNWQFLAGSTVGIVGASKVGREVIKLLEPWPVRILVYDPYLPEEEAEKMGVEKAGLNELFEQSHHITLHLPNTSETEKMVGAEQFNIMRQGATLVNTARGASVDHDALIEKCKNDEIFVCLDVTDPEPLAEDSEFRELDNVYIVPHHAGAGCYGYHQIGKHVLEALRARFAGEEVPHAVNYSRFDILA